MDAAAHKTNELAAYGKVVWFWRPDAGAKVVEQLTSDGDKKARSPGRARRKPLNHRAGNAGMLRLTCGDYFLCAFTFRTQGCGCGLGTRHSLRPPIGGTQIVAKLGRYPRRGNAEVRLATNGAAIHPRHAGHKAGQARS